MVVVTSCECTKVNEIKRPPIAKFRYSF